MAIDIRDKTYITHDDVTGLNFIQFSGSFKFRRHFRQGLRSHVMELLRPDDLEIEKTGTVIDGTRWFPKAKPYKIFRIFRARLSTLESALKETARVKMVEKYLAPDYMACSDEFIVDYASPEGMSLMLCGLQTYIEGEILDPWRILEGEHFRDDLYNRMEKYAVPTAKPQWIECFQNAAAIFIDNIKAMISETGHVPDLAGLGNLMVVPSGQIKLVDINNISTVEFNSTIALDDRGYPVCDKSIEVLWRLEQKILDRPVNTREAIYQAFLSPERMAAVRSQERKFYRKLNPNPQQG